MTLREVKDLIISLQIADPHVDATFARLVNQACEFLELTDAEVARELHCARPTVGRWRNGMAAPHPAMRKPVYNWLLKKMKEETQGLTNTLKEQK